MADALKAVAAKTTISRDSFLSEMFLLILVYGATILIGDYRSAVPKKKIKPEKTSACIL